ncbi:Histone acetyltransferase [Gnomoniopsis smithogilvyi]|uniref:Histone acetyltransferase n=1 Tax=Gnomoniopsis smithogilvyi TaxID=1191159 RepID=A0A9W9CYQ2_9PEZI|nr:Histone acetyltransferase [Gnomoniopsis smithogilvyi]
MSKMGALASQQQLMEEELQQSVRESEENGGYDSEEDAPGDEDIDAPGEEVDEDSGVEEDIDAEGEEVEEEEEEEQEEEDEEEEEAAEEESDIAEDSEEGSDDDAEIGDNDQSEDAEGEPDDEAEVLIDNGPEPLEQSDEEEDDEEEGVGAVKLRPGESDEEEEESDPSEAELFHEESDANSEEGQWDEAVGNEEEDEDSEEAESASLCMFCRQDEDNDPAEEFEVYLTCTGCGESAHQQCARENNALEGKQITKSWLCPECAADSDVEEHEEGTDLNSIVNADAPPATRRATAPKLARDLLPSQRGAMKPDSHSVFNQLVLDDDPMDGSRVLRKRKTSSIEGGEEVINNLRKRRKNTGDSHSIEIEDTVEINGVEDDSRPRSARSLRLKISTNAPATIIKKSRSSLMLRFRVAPSELKKIASKKPKPQKQRVGRRGIGPKPTTTGRPRGRRAETTPLAPFVPSISQPFYSFFDKDMDDKGKPYGGILTEAEADTSKTLPTNEDRRRFDEAKQKAEDDWKERLLQMQAEIDVPVRKSKKSAGPASQIECIEFGGWEIDTWYAAPYPEEYSRNRVLFICEFCLKYMNSDYVAWRHKLKCPAKHPPGDEIYRSGSISVFEVDGRKNPVYCQNLCLLAKLFLGSKTLYYDVEPFLFYVLCEYDDMGYHFVGYFSKEKRASSQNNVSCILTLPIHQRKGYGNLLIDFSYLLTRVEGKCGSPEKPLSDMGLVSYRNYWRLVMCRYLINYVPEDRHEKKGLSVKRISDDTGMTADDVISALEGLRCLVRDPQTQLYAFRVDVDFCKTYVAKWEVKNYVQLDPSALAWTPYVMGRSNATNFELAPAMHAIAPREEDEEQKASEIVIAEIVEEDGGTVQIPVGTNNGGDAEVDAEADVDVDATILESTEPNDNGHKEVAVGDVKSEEAEGALADVDVDDDAEGEDVDKAQGELSTEQPLANGHPAEPRITQEQPKVMSEEDKENSWKSAYDNIPPTRFTVYPPAHGGRRIQNRPPATPRPPVSRTSSASRPKARRSTVRASSSRKARSSSARNRKPGGTGRGPGRWPKGTKKSDYGNADSGPGLPPAWLERQKQRKLAGLPEENASADAVQAVEDEAAALTVEDGPRKINGARKSSARSSRSGGDADGDVEMEDADAVQA